MHTYYFQVLCALLFCAHGFNQSVVGYARHFLPEVITVYGQVVTAVLNHPNILKKLIHIPTTSQERHH